MARGTFRDRILALLMTAPMAFVMCGSVAEPLAPVDPASPPVALTQTVTRDPALVTASLPRQKKPDAPTDTSAPQPDNRSKRSVAFGLF